MSDDASRVLAATDLVALMRETVVLKRRGEQLYGLCPWHADKDPTLRVDPKKQLYYCPSCQIGGNAINWIRWRDSLTFPEALAVLADRAGLSPDTGGGKRAAAPVLPPKRPNFPAPRHEPVTPWGGQRLLSANNRTVFIYQEFPGRRAYLDRAERFPAIDFLWFPPTATADQMYLPPIAGRLVLQDSPTSLWEAWRGWHLVCALGVWRERSSGTLDPRAEVDQLLEIERAAGALALWMEGREIAPGISRSVAPTTTAAAT